jgi:hypothetical protein
MSDISTLIAISSVLLATLLMLAVMAALWPMDD